MMVCLSRGAAWSNNTFDLVVTSPGVTCPAQATATIVTPASLGNKVWLDNNMNGQQDVGEQGLAGVAVELYRSVSGQATGSAIASTVTDQNGNYLFPGLAPDNYIARFLAPAGSVSAMTDAGDDESDSDSDADGYTKEYQLASGDEILSVDAGYVVLSSIAGKEIGRAHV